MSPCKASEIERKRNKIATRAQTRTTITTRNKEEQ
jgi:hypothetical protein